MDIIIKRANHDDLLEQNSIKWKLFANRSIILFVYAFMGIFFLAGNWLTLKGGEYFWGFTSSFGLSLIFLSVFYFSHVYQNKIKYLSRTKEILSRYKNQTEGIEINITDKSVSYKDFEIYSEMKWACFTEYKLYKDYIILNFSSAFLFFFKKSLAPSIVNLRRRSRSWIKTRFLTSMGRKKRSPLRFFLGSSISNSVSQ